MAIDTDFAFEVGILRKPESSGEIDQMLSGVLSTVLQMGKALADAGPTDQADALLLRFSIELAQLQEEMLRRELLPRSGRPPRHLSPVADAMAFSLLALHGTSQEDAITLINDKLGLDERPEDGMPQDTIKKRVSRVHKWLSKHHRDFVQTMVSPGRHHCYTEEELASIGIMAQRPLPLDE